MTLDGLNNWHTWQEIFAQPGIWKAWGRTLEAQIQRHQDWISGQDYNQIWLSGAGTSAFIGDIIADAQPSAYGVPVRAVASTDIVSDPARYLRGAKPLVISFGRSGNSAESLGVLDALDAIAPDTPRLHITCNPAGALATRSSPGPLCVISLPGQTHDAGFAMTSSFTTMMLTALAILVCEKPADPWAILADRSSALLPKVCNWAAALPHSDRIVFVGAGPLRFAAREAALKVMELTAGQIPALWDSSLGFRHGPKSFMTQDTLAIVMRSTASVSALYDDDLVAELRAQYPAANIHVSGAADGPLAFSSGLGDVWDCVLHVQVAQILGAVWSQRLGLNVDDPFQGQGTLSRVVSGVKLYPPEPV